MFIGSKKLIVKSLLFIAGKFEKVAHAVYKTLPEPENKNFF